MEPSLPAAATPPATTNASLVNNNVVRSHLDRLSKLPVELRSQIYDYVFASILDTNTKLDLQACYPTPPLLRVSGSIRHEALPTWTKLMTAADLAARKTYMRYTSAVMRTAIVLSSHMHMGVSMTSKEDKAIQQMATKHEVSTVQLQDLPMLASYAKAVNAGKTVVELDKVTEYTWYGAVDCCCCDN